MESAVAIFDLSSDGKFPLGSYVQGAARVVAAEHAGAVLLPVEERLVSSGPLRAWAHCSLGHGVEIAGDVSMVVARLCIDAQPELPWVYWVAGVVSNGSDSRATFAFAADGSGTAQGGSVSGRHSAAIDPGLAAGEIEIVGGIVRHQVATAGFTGFSVRAVGRGVRVSWVAVSQCADAHRPLWLAAESPRF